MRKHFGQAEIDHMRLALGVDQDVRGLEISMKNSALMRVMHSPGNLYKIPNGKSGEEKRVAAARG
jgi:hypothetical protein